MKKYIVRFWVPEKKNSWMNGKSITKVYEAKSRSWAIEKAESEHPSWAVESVEPYQSGDDWRN